MLDLPFFYQITEGIRITVRPVHVPEQSNPLTNRHVFVYHVRIENVSDTPVQLLWRHWFIHDPVAGDHEVEGEGVIGQQPRIEPGSVHEYQSFCVLRAPSGHMEGYYKFRRPDGTTFRAAIPRFRLRVHAA